MGSERINIKSWGPIVTVLLVFLLVRGVFLQRFGAALDADEAIVGLMGRHILRGQHMAFYYGQNYMGSLEAYLAAIAFACLGATSLALKMVPLAVSALFLLVTARLAFCLSGRKAGTLAGLLLASPPFFFVNWGLKARGGYIETLAIGAVLLMLAHKFLALDSRPEPMPVALKGLRSGAVRTLDAVLVLLAVIILFVVIAGGIVFHPFGVKVSLTSVGNPLCVAMVLLILKWSIILPRIGLRGIWNGPYAFWVALIGFVAGLGWWTNQLVVFYLLPIGIVLAIRERTRVLASDYQCCYGGVAMLSAALGAFPAIVHRLAGAGGQEVFYASVGFSEWLLRLRGYFSQGMPIILGCRGEWTWRDPHTYLSAGIVALHVLAVVALIVRIVRRYRAVKGLSNRLNRLGIEDVLLLALILFPPVFSASSVGWFISEPRYLLPLYSVLPVGMAMFLSVVWTRARPVAVLLTVFLVGYPIFDLIRTDPVTLQPWVANRRLPMSFDPLMAYLRKHDLTDVYANYWIAYRLTFESEETIVATVYPPGQDRYPAYTEHVNRNPSPAYIKTDSERWFPALLAALGVENYRAEAIGSLVVYSDLDLPVRNPSGVPIALAAANVSATHRPDEAALAVDGDRQTRWTSGHPQQRGMAYEVDLGEPTRIGGLLISAGTRSDDYPRGLAIRSTEDGTEWRTLFQFDDLKSVIHRHMRVEHPVRFPGRDLYFEFAPTIARQLRIEALRDDEHHWWSLALLQVFRAAPLVSPNGP